MAFETDRLRGAIRPQDSASIAITLLGVAIALFLDDAVIRLIGACVALLGGAALYMTIRQRLEDQVQVHTRRTTLPPPAFKTRVTTDPGTSTKRIHFDDFQETFVADEDSDAVIVRQPATSSSESTARPEFRTEASRAATYGTEASDDLEFSGGDDGSFRVVRATRGDAASTSAPTERSDEKHAPSADEAPRAPSQNPTWAETRGEKSTQTQDAERAASTSSRGAQSAGPGSQGAGSQGAGAQGTGSGAQGTGSGSRGAGAQGAGAQGTGSQGAWSQGPGAQRTGMQGTGAQAPGAHGAGTRAQTSGASASSGTGAQTAGSSAPSGTSAQHPGSTWSDAGASVAPASERDAAGAAQSGASSQTEIPSDPAVEVDREASRKQVQTILDDLSSEESEDAPGSEPRAEFVRLVGQVLNAVARSMSARSIIFCWVNLQKRHIIPEAKLTTGSVEIRSGARLPIAHDVISQIAESGIPEILTDISRSAESALISYYEGPANTRSFVGVPVFFRREVVGVLAADSTELNAFDESAVATLAEYTRLIAGLIRGYTEKYDLQLTARTLEAFEQMQNAFAGAALSPNQVARILAEQTGQLFDHQYIAVVLFDDRVREWRVAASHSIHGDYHVDGRRPEMNNSLVGYVTRNAEEVYLEQTDREVLFSSDESFQQGGSFIAIPLVGTTRCYGALAVAHLAPSAYIPRDIDLLRDLARFAAMAIEVYNVNNAIDSQSVVDEVTGAFNAEFLASLLERESRRARDYRKPLSYAIVSIDIPRSLQSVINRELEDVIATSVGAAITALVRPYDVVGRIDERSFGVVLVERNDQEAYLWAEKLRKEVAGRIISHGGRKFSVTLSVGICDQSDLPGSETIVAGAAQALERARSGEGNAVILY